MYQPCFTVKVEWEKSESENSSCWISGLILVRPTLAHQWALPFQVWPQRPRWPSSRLYSDTTDLPAGYTLIQLIINDLKHFWKDIFKNIHILTKTQVVSVVQTVHWQKQKWHDRPLWGVGPKRVPRWRSYISLVPRDIFLLAALIKGTTVRKTIM